MKTILVHIPVLFFCILCSDWQIGEISPGGCESACIASNYDSFHNGSSKPGVPIDDTPDSQMFSSSQSQILNPERYALCILHLQNFNGITRRYYFPDLAIPPPVC
jgi:hypothetical protein